MPRLRRQLALTLRRRPLAPFLLAATVAFGFATAISSDQTIWGSYAYGIAGLLGLWASQLRRGWIARLLIAGGATTATAFIGLLRNSHSQFSRSLTILLLYMAMVTLACAVIRILISLRQPRDGTGRSKPVRFSVMGLLAIMTFVAVVTPLLRLADLPPEVNLFAAIYAIWSTLPMIALLMTRTRLNAPLQAVGILGSAALVGWLFISVVLTTDDYWWGTLLQGVFYMAWLLGLRVAMSKVVPQRHLQSPHG